MAAGLAQSSVAQKALVSASSERVSSLARGDFVIGSHYKLHEKIGAGSFGDIYSATVIATGEEVAIKIEHSKANFTDINDKEKGKQITLFRGDSGFLLPVRFCLTAINFRLEIPVFLIIHFQPDNFLMGAGRQCNRVFLIDFGLAKRYMNSTFNKHISYRENKVSRYFPTIRCSKIGTQDHKQANHPSAGTALVTISPGRCVNAMKVHQNATIITQQSNPFAGVLDLKFLNFIVFKNLTGTARYASLNAHNGIEQSRRDDLESLGYVLVYLLRFLILIFWRRFCFSRNSHLFFIFNHRSNKIRGCLVLDRNRFFMGFHVDLFRKELLGHANPFDLELRTTIQASFTDINDKEKGKQITLFRGDAGFLPVRFCLTWGHLKYGTHNDYNVMVMDLLGPSLEDLFNFCGRRFTLKTVLMLAEQMISRIEFMHAKYFIHRDIKPDNFLMGAGRQCNRVFLIDFGLAKRYMNPTFNKHISYRENKNLTGTARYASLNAHNGIEQSRRDDLESLGYVLVYLLRGSLPWQGVKAATKRQKYQKIFEKKLSTSVQELCKGFPSEFGTCMNYCRKLKFDQKPEYNYLKLLFRHLFKSLNFRVSTILIMPLTLI
ncbi:unnamed protein product [Gongylonema pulchrum]|uniref:non-specific serine/threonine protein kinase n=1 Tax=Gongylonema pulchrum TaxID=637853 RepID=A0A183DWN6_9BILA|nr:unnamed protein product [Gongylonema pulchrum]